MSSTSKKLCAGFLFLALSAFFVPKIFSHCQIPCGIYDDEMRFTALAEHMTTIEKSMKQIAELSEDGAHNANQIVRWVNNKEKHADELSDIVTYYFMAQRVKPADKDDAQAFKDYTKKLVLLHHMLVSSMKAKQTTDLSHVENLRTALADFRVAYFGKK